MEATLAVWTTFLLFVFLFWVLPVIITYRDTKRKNRNYRLWTLFAVLFGWLTAVIAILSTKLDREVKF